MKVSVFIYEFLEFNLHELEMEEDGICTVFAIDDLVSIGIGTGELLGVTVKLSLHFGPSIFKFLFGTVIGSRVCEDLNFR